MPPSPPVKGRKWVLFGILMTVVVLVYVAIMYKIVHYGP